MTPSHHYQVRNTCINNREKSWVAVCYLVPLFGAVHEVTEEDPSNDIAGPQDQ